MSVLANLPEPTWMRVHRRSRAAQAGAIGLFTAVFDGLWLGFLDQEHFDELDDSFYAGAARQDVNGRPRSYRDDEYTRSGLHDWESDALDAFPSSGKIVVTGAGGGREVLALLERGYDAMGYEPNQALVESGNDLLERLGHGRRLHPIGRSVFPDAASADGIVVGWGSYIHIPGRDRRIEFLRRARASVETGCPLLISFVLRPERRYFRMSARVANALRRLRRADRIEVGDCLRTTLFHVFTREEIESELVASGFRLESFEAEPYGHAVARAL